MRTRTSEETTSNTPKLTPAVEFVEPLEGISVKDSYALIAPSETRGPNVRSHRWKMLPEAEKQKEKQKRKQQKATKSKTEPPYKQLPYNSTLRKRLEQLQPDFAMRLWESYQKNPELFRGSIFDEEAAELYDVGQDRVDADYGGSSEDEEEKPTEQKEPSALLNILPVADTIDVILSFGQCNKIHHPQLCTDNCPEFCPSEEDDFYCDTCGCGRNFHEPNYRLEDGTSLRRVSVEPLTYVPPTVAAIPEQEATKGEDEEDGGLVHKNRSRRKKRQRGGRRRASNRVSDEEREEEEEEEGSAAVLSATQQPPVALDAIDMSDPMLPSSEGSASEKYPRPIELSIQALFSGPASFLSKSIVPVASVRNAQAEPGNEVHESSFDDDGYDGDPMVTLAGPVLRSPKPTRERFTTTTIRTSHDGPTDWDTMTSEEGCSETSSLTESQAAITEDEGTTPSMDDEDRPLKRRRGRPRKRQAPVRIKKEAVDILPRCHTALRRTIKKEADLPEPPLRAPRRRPRRKAGAQGCCIHCGLSSEELPDMLACAARCGKRAHLSCLPLDEVAEDATWNCEHCEGKRAPTEACIVMEGEAMSDDGYYDNIFLS